MISALGIDSGRITRPLERGLVAVGRQLRRRGIRVALFGAVEFADLAEVDFRQTNLDLLVLLVVELAVAQLAFDGEVRALFQSGGERRKIGPRDHPVRFTYSPDFLSFQDACVASDRTVYSFPLFVLFTSASFPKNPINLTVLSYIEKSPLMP